MFWNKKDKSLAATRDMENALKVVAARLLTLSEQIARLQSQVDQIAKIDSKSAEKMADRLIQMSMVQRGSSHDASVHRNVSRMEEPQADNWQDDGNAWPPPGCAAIDMP